MVKGLRALVFGTCSSLMLSCAMQNFTDTSKVQKDFSHFSVGKDGLYKKFDSFFEKFDYRIYDSFDLDSLATVPMMVRMRQLDFFNFIKENYHQIPDDSMFLVSADNQMVFNVSNLKQSSRLAQYIKHHFDNLDYVTVHKESFDDHCAQMDIATAIFESVEAAKQNKYSSLRYHHFFSDKKLWFGVNTPLFLSSQSRKKLQDVYDSFEKSSVEYVTASIQQLFSNPRPLVEDRLFYFNVDQSIPYADK